MKYLPSILQITGALLIVSGVATYNPILAVILSGGFFVLFGVAIENRGK